MIQRITWMFLIVMMSIASLVMASEPEMGLDIRINGIRLEFDSQPYIESDRTMVPLRALGESLGATSVMWKEVEREVVIVFEEKTILMPIDSRTYLVNDEVFTMDVAATIKDNRTMVPLRVIAEQFACEVEWNDQLRTVEINLEGLDVKDPYLATNQYTYNDVLWLSRIVYLEGLDIGYEAKLAIANVILNRVKDERFPNTVYDVIFDSKYAVQFPPAHRSSFPELIPNQESYLAAKNALDGLNNIESCLYFNNAPFKWKAEELYEIIEGEYFYY